MKKLFLMFILIPLFSSSYSQVQIIEVIPVEKVTDTNETTRVNELVDSLDNLQTDLNTFDNKFTDENMSIWNEINNLNTNQYDDTNLVNLIDEVNTNSSNRDIELENDLLNVISSLSNNINVVDDKFTSENQSIWNNFLNYFTSSEIISLFYNRTQIDNKLSDLEELIVVDTNETTRVDELVNDISSLESDLNSINNFSGNYTDLTSVPNLDLYNETNLIIDLEDNLETNYLDLDEINSLIDNIDTNETTRVNQIIVNVDNLQTDLNIVDNKFTDENISIWNEINNLNTNQYNDTNLINLIDEVNTNSSNRDNILDNKFTSENQSIWNNFLNYINSTQISNLFYNKTEIDDKLDLKVNSSKILTEGSGDKFLSDTGDYIETPRESYPYVTSDIDEQFRVSETKNITIVGEGFTPSDILEGIESEGYLVDYILRSPTQFILNITAPNIEKFASEYSFSGHEAWGNGKKIIFQTVDLFAENLFKTKNYNCFQKYSGDFYCVGYNQYANLAIGINNRTSPILTPTKSVIENATKVEIINNGNFALLENKTLIMWGRDGNGQFGLGNNNNELYYFNTTYLNGELIKDFSLGGNTICAIRDSDQKVYCSGYSSSYYEIPGYSSNQYTPVYASSIPKNLKQFQLAGRGGCYIDSSNRLYCWGWDNGRFGRGTTNQKLSSPTHIASSIEKFNMGYTYHMCYLTTSKQIKCSGYNNDYQSGSQSGGNSLTSFFTVPNIVDPIDIKLGGYHSIALQENGEIKTWGANSIGQLGDGTTTKKYNSNVKFENGSIITTATKITASEYGGCAILEDSSVYCWGRNNYGQLGDGTTTTSLYAKPVKGFAFE